MRRHRLSAAAPAAAVLAVLGAALLLTAGCGRGDETAATVAGERYTVDDLHAYLATSDDDPVAERSAAAEWISRWVFFTAIEMEMAERGVVVTAEHEAQAVAELSGGDPEFVPGAPGGTLRVHQQAVVRAALEWSEAEAAEQFELSGRSGDDELRHLCSSHILVATQAEADSVLERLDAGEPFGLLALELSLDPGSGSVGGELGCVVEGSFVAPFEDAAYAAQPGQVAVAESQFGFHVIEVASSGPATAESHPQLDAATLARMAADAEQAASVRSESERQQRQQEAITELQTAAVERYGDQVRVHERYGHWDPAGFRVVIEPPA